MGLYGSGSGYPPYIDAGGGGGGGGKFKPSRENGGVGGGGGLKPGGGPLKPPPCIGGGPPNMFGRRAGGGGGGGSAAEKEPDADWGVPVRPPVKAGAEGFEVELALSAGLGAPGGRENGQRDCSPGLIPFESEFTFGGIVEAGAEVGGSWEGGGRGGARARKAGGGGNGGGGPR